MMDDLDWQSFFYLLLTEWSTIGMRDCNTFATLNLMLGTLAKQHIPPRSILQPN